MTAFTAVLLYAGWTLLLPVIYAGTLRTPLIATGRKRADHWERGKPNDDPPLLARAKNAHLNCTENFPVFAAIVFVAALTGKIAIADAVAGYVLFARVAQSVVHMLGTSLPLIALRGFFYATQVALMFWMIGKLIYS
ncbi:MAG TPA: MAPEG family protein [Rhodanobacteraceae bacterium]